MPAKKGSSIIKKDSSVIQRIISQAAEAGKESEAPEAPKASQKMFYMSPEEHKWLKRLSIEKGKSMSELLSEGIREHIFSKYKKELDKAQKG